MIIALIIGAVILAAVVLGFLIMSSLRVVVPTNMVHIVQRGNKTILYGNSHPESGNVYYNFPEWVIGLGVKVTQFKESIFPVTLKDHVGQDINQVPFSVSVAAFFKVKDAVLVSKHVANFEDLHAQLELMLKGAVRRILSAFPLETRIMIGREEFSKMFTIEVSSQISQWGIETVNTIELMDINDAPGSKVIENIRAKNSSVIDRESREVVAINSQKAQTAEIESKRAIEVNRQDAEQQVGLRTAQKEREVGIAKQQAEQLIQEQTKMTTERQMEVQSVQQNRKAEIEKGVAITNAEAAKQVAIVTAEATKQRLVIDAQGQAEAVAENAKGQKEANAHTAEGNLIIALKNAEGVKAEGQAKAEADKAIGLAAVAPQITLAEQIGGNANYQQYLIDIKKIDVDGQVGMSMAAALEKADLKIISNGGSGNVLEGTSGLLNMFGSKGGTAIAGLLSGIAQTEEGKALVNKMTGVTEKVVD